MQIRTLWGQRKNSYAGETLPELMVAWDEYALDDNSIGYEQAKKDEIAAWGDDLVAVRELVIDVPTETITAMFDVPVVTAHAAPAPEDDDVDEDDDEFDRFGSAL